MAITKTVEIVTKTKQAAENIKDLFDGLLKKQLKAQEATEDLNESFDNLGKDTTSSLKKIEKSTEEAEESTNLLAKGFKGVGLALKAAGIGLIISGFNTLKEVFTQNQKVADTLSTAFETLSVVFNEVTSVVLSVVEKVSKATNGLEGLKNVISGLITIALTPLKLVFYKVSIAISELQLAWEESFLGDGNPETIAKLAKRIVSQKEALVEVGESAIEAGAKVANNIGKAITEVGAIVEGTVEGVSKISISSAYETAKANIQLENTAKLAEAQQARLVEQYDRQAEKLRQIRDNDLSSISDRQKANDELLDVLNKQEQAMLAQAAAQIASAQANFNKNKSIENQVELTNALGNREGVLAQIEGLRSEQDSNKNALIKEQLDLVKARSAAETDNAINQKLFEAERLKDEEKRLQAEKEAIEFQRQTKLAELEANIEIYKQGTQARLDAEIEYNTQKQELDNEIIAKEDEIAQYKLDKKAEEVKKEEELEQQRVASKRAALDAIIGLVNAESGVGRAALVAKEILNVKEMIMEAKKTLTFASLAGAKSTTAIAEGTAQTAKVGFPQNIPLLIGYGAQAIGIFSAIKSAVSKTKNIASSMGASGGGGSSIGSAPQIASPSFNVVGNTGVNQIAETLGSQQPVQAYVVANNVTTAQSLDRNIISNASLG